jgi:putative transcriptional regulator
MTRVYSKYVKLTLQILMEEIIENTVSHFRQKDGLTQEELASRVGVTRQTIIALEKGNYVPSVLLALKIAHVFKQSLETIFTLRYKK